MKQTTTRKQSSTSRYYRRSPDIDYEHDIVPPDNSGNIDPLMKQPMTIRRTQTIEIVHWPLDIIVVVLILIMSNMTSIIRTEYLKQYLYESSATTDAATATTTIVKMTPSINDSSVLSMGMTVVVRSLWEHTFISSLIITRWLLGRKNRPIIDPTRLPSKHSSNLCQSLKWIDLVTAIEGSNNNGGLLKSQRRPVSMECKDDCWTCLCLQYETSTWINGYSAQLFHTNIDRSCQHPSASDIKSSKTIG